MHKYDVWSVTSNTTSLITLLPTSESYLTDHSMMDTRVSAEKAEEKVEKLGVGLTGGEEVGRRVLSTLEGKNRLLQFKRGLGVSAEAVIPTVLPTSHPTARPTVPPPPTAGGTTIVCLVHIHVILPENSDMNTIVSRVDLDLFKDYTNKNLQLYVNKALAALIASDSFKEVDVNSKKRKITGAVVERITWKKDDKAMRFEKTVNRPSSRAYLAVFASPLNEYVKMLRYFSFSFLLCIHIWFDSLCS
jgi:hypothetical protein